MKKLLGWAAQGAIRPHVSHVFDLADFKTALRALELGNRRRLRRSPDDELTPQNLEWPA